MWAIWSAEIWPQRRAPGNRSALSVDSFRLRWPIHAGGVCNSWQAKAAASGWHLKSNPRECTSVVGSVFNLGHTSQLAVVRARGWGSVRVPLATGCPRLAAAPGCLQARDCSRSWAADCSSLKSASQAHDHAHEPNRRPELKNWGPSRMGRRLASVAIAQV